MPKLGRSNVAWNQKSSKSRPSQETSQCSNLHPSLCEALGYTLHEVISVQMFCIWESHALLSSVQTDTFSWYKIQNLCFQLIPWYPVSLLGDNHWYHFKKSSRNSLCIYKNACICSLAFYIDGSIPTHYSLSCFFSFYCILERISYHYIEYDSHCI